MATGDQILDRLYSAPLDRFVSERNTLVKELRGEGDDEQAAEVAMLRKPSMVAWALNQVARADRERVDQLFEVQGEMERAASAEALRSASEKRQDILTSLASAAVAELERSGHAGESARNRIGLTLLALGTNGEAAELFRRGRLDDEVKPGATWEASVTLAAAGELPDDDSSAERHRLERARKELRALQDKATRLEERAQQAGQRLEEARRQAKTAAKAASDARQEAQRLAAEMGEAEHLLSD